MISTYKKYTFASDTVDVDFLSNLKSVLTKNSWVVDKDDITTNDELYIHNSKDMYFSLKLVKAYNDETKKCLLVHGNTGFDASLSWDAQPGKFTTLLNLLSYSGHDTNLDQPRWDVAGNHTTSQTYWISAAKEQIIFINNTSILLVTKFTVTDFKDTSKTYSFYLPYFIGSLNLISDTISGGNAVIPSCFDAFIFFNSLPYLTYQRRNSDPTYLNLSYGSSSPLYSTGILINNENVDCLTEPKTKICLTNAVSSYYINFVTRIPDRSDNILYYSPTYHLVSKKLNDILYTYKGFGDKNKIFNISSVVPYMFNKLTRDVYLQEYFAFINDTSNVCKIFATMPWYLGPTITKSSNDTITQDSKKYNIFPIYELLGTDNKSDISMYIPYEDGV